MNAIKTYTLIKQSPWFPMEIDSTPRQLVKCWIRW